MSGRDKRALIDTSDSNSDISQERTLEVAECCGAGSFSSVLFGRMDPLRAREVKISRQCCQIPGNLTEINKLKTKTQTATESTVSRVDVRWCSCAQPSGDVIVAISCSLRQSSCAEPPSVGAQQLSPQLSDSVFKYVFSTCKIWPGYSRERALSSLPDPAVQQ